MKKSFVNWIVPVSLSLGSLASAQQAAPAPAAVEGVTGVKQEAVSSVKQLETGTANPTGGVTTGAKNDAQAVNKVNGVETIKALRKRLVRDIPAIVVTGDTRQEIVDRITMHRIGMVVKPAQADEILKMVASLVPVSAPQTVH
jgi:DNA-binding NarL/FixJ family response regulator